MWACTWLQINGCQYNAHFAWTSMMFMLVEWIFFECSCKWPLCSHQPLSLKSRLSLILGEFFAYTWLWMWDNLHTLNARLLAYCGFHILAWEFVEVLNYRVVPILWITQALHSLSTWIWLVKGLPWGIKHDIFLCISSSI